MSDVFLSYASVDLERIKPIVLALQQQKLSVWWDRKIPPGKTFAQVIKEELNAAKCIVVVWSKASVQSDWVETEAAVGKKRGVLIPVLIDNVANDIPLEFLRIEAATLTGWDGSASAPEFVWFYEAISGKLGLSPQPQQEPARTPKPQPALPRPSPRRFPSPWLWYGSGGIALLGALWFTYLFIHIGPHDGQTGPEKTQVVITPGDVNLVQSRIKEALKNKLGRDIGVEISSNKVILTGHVRTFRERESARDIAMKTAVGIPVTMKLEVEIGDKKIIADVTKALDALEGTLVIYPPVSKQGVVTLTGHVPTSQHRVRAEEIARQIDGVVSVRNNLEVKP